MNKWIHSFGKRPMALLYFLIYLPWFALLERFVNQYYLLECKLDYMIPFCEYFIVPYIFWFIYSAMVCCWFFFRESDRDYWRLCFCMAGGMTIALIIYTIFPNGIQIRPNLDPEKNIFCYMTSLIYSTDTSTNVFPSLHTYTSVLFIFFVKRSKLVEKHHWLHYVSVFISLSIVASTVLLKQHCVLDMLAGTIMAASMYSIAYADDEERKLLAKKREWWKQRKSLRALR